MRPFALLLLVFASLVQGTPADAAVTLPCQATVTKSVKLNADVGTEGSPCLFWGIAANKSGITIDLNGHTVWGTPGDDNNLITEVGVFILEGIDNVTVRNGIMRGWENSLRAGNSDGNTIDDIASAGTDFSSIVIIGNGNTVSDSTAVAGINGFASTGTKNSFLRNTATHNRADGFNLNAAALYEVSGNEASDNADDGFDFTNMSRSTFTKNRAFLNASRGINAENGEKNTFKRNRVGDNADRGIYITGAKMQVIGNDASGGDFFGIDLGVTDSMIAGNHMTGNAERGLIAFGDRNTFDGNVARANFVGITVGGDDIVVTNNVANGNGLDGINIDPEGGVMGSDDSDGVRIANNRANGNGFNDGGFGPGRGIAVYPTLVINVIEGPNTARGNADTAECSPASLCN